VLSELDVCALEPGKGKGVGGDAGHGGRLCKDWGREGSGEKREDASAIGEHDFANLELQQMLARYGRQPGTEQPAGLVVA
jgi:hypothetical protein